MKKSVVQLDDFLLMKLHVDWHEAHKLKESESRLGFDYDINRHSKEKHRFMLQFKLSLRPRVKKDALGYNIEAEIWGLFSFPKGTKEEKMQY